MIILEKIKEHSKNNPTKTAVIEDARQLNYADLWYKILGTAAYFSGLGKKGDRIIISATKNLEFVTTYFGAHLAGLITITIDSAINEDRLSFIVDSTKPIGIWGDLVTKKFETQKFSDISCEHVIEPVFPSETDIADILFTTGTTGAPKGVVLTHANEWAAATNINTFIGNDSESVELLALPISHSFGLGRLRCIMQLGATIDLLGSFANVRKFFRELDKQPITGFGMVPASWNYLSEMSDDLIGEYADQLKYIEIGSAPMPVEQKQRLMRLLPKTRICMHYGLTEASRSAFMCFSEEDDLTTIGKASPNVELEIFNENGQLCKLGEQGELCVKGDHVCSDYWGMSLEEYRKSFFGDYYRTGDWGYCNEQGKYYLVSRKKELINVGGKKVSPLEVETVLNDYPGVKESVCIGVPDRMMGEVVKAFVVMEQGTTVDLQELTKYARGRLEDYKVPAQVESIDAIPKTSSGKIQRLSLKK